MKKYFVIIYNGTKKIASTYKNAESKEWAESMAEWAFMCLYSDIEFTHAVAELAETDDWKEFERNAMYKATATFTDGVKEWCVIIYSQYKTMQDALDGVKRFTSKGYNVVMIRIEKNPS